MDNIDSLNLSKINIEEAGFATVGDFWKDIVYFYQNKRIYYITEGDALLYLKRKEIKLKSGYLYYIPEYSIVTAKCDKIMSHYYVHFSTDPQIDSLLHSPSLINEIEAPGYTKDIFDVILKECPSKELPSVFAKNGALLLLLSFFLKNITYNEGEQTKFSDILQYINDNIDREITVEELSGIANLNKNYFSNSFTKEFGIPPIKYISEQKISKAMYLLFSTAKPIKEICFSLGYSSESYFSRVFKFKTGVTPQEFRYNASKNKKRIPK